MAEQTERLVMLAREGDSAAFSQLYAAYYKEMFRYAYCVLGTAEDAEDAVMDTVADAFSSIRSLRDAAKFKHWIFKILCNKAKRQRGRLYSRRTAELPESYAGGTGLEETETENMDLLRAMSGLAGDERRILTLSVTAGYSSEEIAAMLSMNANTVRSKQRRALLKLRRALGGGEVGTDE